MVKRRTAGARAGNGAPPFRPLFRRITRGVTNKCPPVRYIRSRGRSRSRRRSQARFARRRRRAVARARARAVAAHAHGLGLRHRPARGDVSQGDVDRRARAPVRQRDAVRAGPQPAPDRSRARARRASASGRPRDLERLLALLVLDRLARSARAPARASPALDWRRRRGVDDAIARERRRREADRARRVAARLARRAARRRLGRRRRAARARAQPARADDGAREPARRRSRDALATALAAEGLATHAGRVVRRPRSSSTARTNLFATDAFKRGAIEAQDEGSQLLAELAVAGDRPSRSWSTTAPAPAARRSRSPRALGNRGRIVATDVDDSKLEELRRRARRAKVSNAQAMHRSTIARARRAARQGRRRVRRRAVLGHRRAPPQPRGALAAARGRPRRLRDDASARSSRPPASCARRVAASSTRRARCCGIENEDVVDAVPRPASSCRCRCATSSARARRGARRRRVAHRHAAPPRHRRVLRPRAAHESQRVRHRTCIRTRPCTSDSSVCAAFGQRQALPIGNVLAAAWYVRARGWRSMSAWSAI